jgi:hypothetical protein
MDFKRMANPTFLIAAAVLAGGAGFVYAWVAVLGLHPIKEPVPLQQYVDEFPARFRVGEEFYVRIHKQTIAKEELNSLFHGGMGEYEDYLNWWLVPLREARSILVEKQNKLRGRVNRIKDREYREQMTKFVEADLRDPAVLRKECDLDRHRELFRAKHLAGLFITYYTGSADVVPHVPDRCYLGAGYQQTGQRIIDVSCGGIQWGGRNTFPVKVLEFERRLRQTEFRLETAVVAYYFVANWQYMPERAMVRLTLADPRSAKAFFSKVEVKLPNLGSGQKPQVESSLRGFLQAIAPIYERSFLSPPSGGSEGGSS